MRGLLLQSSKDEPAYGSIDIAPSTYQSTGNNHWETLEFYLVSTLYSISFYWNIPFLLCLCLEFQWELKCLDVDKIAIQYIVLSFFIWHLYMLSTCFLHAVFLQDIVGCSRISFMNSTWNWANQHQLIFYE